MLLPVTLPLRYSRSLAAALVAAHGLAAAGLVPTALPLAVKLSLWLALAVSSALTLRRRPETALVLQTDGCLQLIMRDGTHVEARLLSATTVLPWLVVLVMRVDGRSRTLVLPVDALDAEAHRQLRLWLRWKVSAATA